MLVFVLVRERKRERERYGEMKGRSYVSSESCTQVCGNVRCVKVAYVCTFSR